MLIFGNNKFNRLIIKMLRKILNHWFTSNDILIFQFSFLPKKLSE